MSGSTDSRTDRSHLSPDSNISNESRRSQPENPSIRENYQAHTPTREEYILSAIGEGVVAKALGIPFRPTNDKGVHEPVGGYQVRTRPNSGDELIIRTEDNDEATFVLVTRVSELEYDLIGTITGLEAKQPRWWRADAREGSGWFVPQSELDPLTSENFKAKRSA